MSQKAAQEDELTQETQAEIAKLKAKLAMVEEQLAAKDKHIANQEQRIEKLTARGAGWLVTTINPLYDGTTLGVSFISGQAFVSRDRKFERFEVKPLKEAQLARMNKDEIERYEKRRLAPSAEYCVKALVDDFGYEALFFDGTDTTTLDRLISERAKERAEAQRAIDELGADQTNLLRPARAGVVTG